MRIRSQVPFTVLLALLLAHSELCPSPCPQKGNAPILKTTLAYKRQKEQLNRSIGTESRSYVENTPQRALAENS